MILQRFDGPYVLRLRDGDPETERHFAAYFGELLRIKLRSRLRSRQLVEEACQETFVHVLRALRSVDGIRQPERLGAFVNAVCDHVLQEVYRSEQRHRPASDHWFAAVEDRAPGADDRLVDAERRALVRRIVDELPPRDRRLLRALFLEEHDKDAVCDELGVDRSHLRVLLHRAKLRFRALYGERQGAGASPMVDGGAGG